LPKSISFLKGSVNYAEVGNGGRFGLLNSVYNYSQGAGNGFLTRSLTLPFPELKPEIVKNLEFGLEARFANNRIGFTATYYKSNSTNQLLNISLPVATGYQTQYINAGNIQNKGFELVVSGTPVRNRNLSWDVAFNFAMNRSTVVALDPLIKIFYLGGGFGRSATPVVEEGKAYGDLLAFKWAKDASGNHLVTAAGKPVITQAQESIGNYNPKATYGLSNTLNYKNISLRLLIDGRAGGIMVSGTEMNLAFSGIPEVTQMFREGGLNLGGVDATGRPVTTTINSQDFWQIASGKRYGNGEFFAYDATNFRVREVSIGYVVPVSSPGLVKAVKVSLVGRNLFWLYRGSSLLDIPGIGKRKMWFDPDMSIGNGNFQGVEYGVMPSTRSLGVNLQLTF
jgi:outer membrane receptor protein involved in Fe transport